MLIVSLPGSRSKRLVVDSPPANMQVNRVCAGVNIQAYYVFKQIHQA